MEQILSRRLLRLVEVDTAALHHRQLVEALATNGSPSRFRSGFGIDHTGPCGHGQGKCLASRKLRSAPVGKRKAGYPENLLLSQKVTPLDLQPNANTFKAKQKVKDMFEPLREADTNGDNYDLRPEDIIKHLKQWQKLCSFTLSDVDYDQVTLNFETLPKELDVFVNDAVEFCPDLIMDDEDAEIPLLKKQLAKTMKLRLWWD